MIKEGIILHLGCGIKETSPVWGLFFFMVFFIILGLFFVI